MSPRLDDFICWLYDTARGKVILWVLERMAFALGAIVMLWAVAELESRLAPVVTNWSMDYAERRGDVIVLGGRLKKNRACELVSTSVMAVPKRALAPRRLIWQAKPHEIMGGNTPTGLTTWGPIEIRIPAALLQNQNEISYLEVIGIHRCHALWSQETHYGTVEVSRIL